MDLKNRYGHSVNGYYSFEDCDEKGCTACKPAFTIYKTYKELSLEKCTTLDEFIEEYDLIEK